MGNQVASETTNRPQAGARRSGPSVFGYLIGPIVGAIWLFLPRLIPEGSARDTFFETADQIGRVLAPIVWGVFVALMLYLALKSVFKFFRHKVNGAPFASQDKLIGFFAALALAFAVPMFVTVWIVSL